MSFASVQAARLTWPDRLPVLAANTCWDGRELPSEDPSAEEQVTAASKEKVLDAVGEAASKLRVKLG